MNMGMYGSFASKYPLIQARIGFPMANLAAYTKMDALTLAPVNGLMLAFKTSTFAPLALGAD